MRRKKQEVCGKPTQYNLQTMEYNWRELPNTKIQPLKQEPPRKDYRRHSLISNTFPQSYKTKYHDSPDSETRPSRVEPAFAKELTPPAVRVSAKGPNIYPPVKAVDPDLKLPSLLPPQLSSEVRGGVNFSLQPWTHETIRRMLESNRGEAVRSYLPS